MHVRAFQPDFFTPIGPGFRAIFMSSDAGRASGLFYASPYFYILDIHQLVMKNKIAKLVETIRDHGGSMVFSVPQQQKCMQ